MCVDEIIEADQFAFLSSISPTDHSLRLADIKSDDRMYINFYMGSSGNISLGRSMYKWGG